MTFRGRGQLSLLLLYGPAGVVSLGCGGLVETDADDHDLSSAGSTNGIPTVGSTGGHDGSAAGGTGGHFLQPGAGGASSPGGGIHPEDEPSMTGPFLIADPEAFCARVCSPEALQDPCVEEQACYPGRCVAEAENWDMGMGDAFEKCVSEEPLCFQSIEGCMLDVLYPSTEPRTHILVIENLEPDVLKYLYAGALSPADLAPLFGDTFTTETSAWMSWFEPWASDIGPNFYVWIDVDRDALCESGQDSFGVAAAKWNGSFDGPTYEAHMTEYFDDGAAACPVLGFEDVGEAAE